MALQQESDIELAIISEEEDLKKRIFETVKNSREWREHASSHKGAELVFLEDTNEKKNMKPEHHQPETGASIYGPKPGETVEAFCRCGGMFEVELDGSKINPRVHFKSSTIYEQWSDSAGVPYGRGNSQSPQSGTYGPKQDQSYLK